MASTPRSATRRRRISDSTSSFSSRRRAWNSSSARRSASVAVAYLALLARLAHHPGGQALEVQLPQRSIEVVGAADGPAGLHAREAVHGHTGELAHLLPVHVHERLEEHLRQLLGRDVAHRAAALGAHGLHGLEVGRTTVVALADPRRVEREIDVEDGLEGAPVVVVLHQGRSERGLERAALGDVDVLDGAHGVEVLGHRHREPGRPQLVDEPLEHVEHGLTIIGRRAVRGTEPRHGVVQLRRVHVVHGVTVRPTPSAPAAARPRPGAPCGPW